MIVVLGSVIARAPSYKRVLALSQEHVRRSRAQPGCLAHAVHVDTENPRRLVFVEQWASAAALWDHFKVPESLAFAKAIGELAQEAPTVAVYDSMPVVLPGRGAS